MALDGPPSKIYDLYGLLGVSPIASTEEIDKTYRALTKQLSEELQDTVNVAYSILSNPYKRTQYDRDRLNYLYDNMNKEQQTSFATGMGANISEIHDYAANLMNRVDDPNEGKKTKAIRDLAALRGEVEEYTEASMEQRSVWTTSSNKVMRAAGTALCDVLVAAEDQLRELEDELGRADGLDKLEPRLPDKDMPFLASGLGFRTLPSLPRSPTQRVVPLSASKVGAPMNDLDSDSGHGSKSNSEAETEILAPAATASLKAIKTPTNIYHGRHNAASAPTLPRISQPLRTFDLPASTEPVGMGLVEFQRLHGLLDPNDQENDAIFAMHQIPISRPNVPPAQQEEEDTTPTKQTNDGSVPSAKDADPFRD